LYKAGQAGNFMETKEVGKHRSLRLVIIGTIILIFLVQFLAFIQGFYIAMARLDYFESMVMLRPTFLYAAPFYFLMGRWIACREPKRYIFFPLMVTLISIMVNSLFYYYLYRVPLTFYAIDPAILSVYFLVTVFGGVIGNKAKSP
jgi:hypothetical protein